MERLREVLRLKRLLGLSLDELRELSAGEAARAARLAEWHGGVEIPCVVGRSSRRDSPT